MSEKIPSSPILMRLNYRIRNLITPNQNILYLILESVLISALTFVYYYEYIGIQNIAYALPCVGFIMMVLLRVLTVEPDKWKKEQYTMEFSFKLTILCVLIAMIPVGLVYYQYGQTITTQISAIAISVYGVGLYLRSRKYLGEREFYTDAYSNVSQQWEMASVSLEKAMEQEEKGNSYRAHYWSTRAASYYEEIVEEEERLALREAASAFSAGCEFLSVSVFTEGNESYSFYSAAQESFERGGEKLSERVCDSCGRRRKIDRCQRVIGDEQKRYVYCDTCRRQKKSSGTKQTSSQRRKSKREQNRTKTNNQATGGKKRSKTSASQNKGTSGSNSKNQYTRTKSKSDRMSRQDALDTLGIDKEDPSDDMIHSAFREKVKKSHPDTGGSEEEFKKVKRARERLV